MPRLSLYRASRILKVRGGGYWRLNFRLAACWYGVLEALLGGLPSTGRSKGIAKLMIQLLQLNG